MSILSRKRILNWQQDFMRYLPGSFSKNLSFPRSYAKNNVWYPHYFTLYNFVMNMHKEIILCKFRIGLNHSTKTLTCIVKVCLLTCNVAIHCRKFDTWYRTKNKFYEDYIYQQHGAHHSASILVTVWFLGLLLILVFHSDGVTITSHAKTF